MTIANEDVTVSIEIAASPDTVFKTFTNDVDTWWRRGPKYRFVTPFQGRLTFEAGEGGRFLHLSEDGDLLHIVGAIQIWQPGKRLKFEWRGTNFAPDQVTYVDIHFAPTARGTLVTVMHQGFGTLPKEHAARHGQVGRTLIMFVGGWWGELLSDLKGQAQLRERTNDCNT